MENGTAIELGLAAIVGTFHKYAGDDSETLSKAEFKKMVNEELVHLVTAGGPSVDQLMEVLDSDADGTVDFKEYMMLIGSMAFGLNHVLKQMK